MKLHPACKLFPKLGDVELRELADDIRQNGLQNRITLLDGKILDGRNRHAACKLAGVEARFIEWDGSGSPVEWVISQNLMRRHLTASQRAVVALDLLPMLEKEAKQRQRQSKGRGIKVAKTCATSNGKSSEIAARLTKSNARYVESAKSIVKSAPELLKHIRSGDLSLSDAKWVAELTARDRKKLLAEANGDGFDEETIRRWKSSEDGKQYPSAKNHWQQKRNGSSDPRILHPTPPHVTEALLDRESFDGPILEPASGDGAMAAVLRKQRYKVRATDINNGHDFLARKSKVANIVTNPPYGQSMAEVFVRHAMEIAENKIAMLLPFYFLEGVQRHSLFSNPDWPVKAVYVFSRRPTFGEHPDHSPFGSVWVVWDRSHQGSPKIEWILETESEAV